MVDGLQIESIHDDAGDPFARSHEKVADASEGLFCCNTRPDNKNHRIAMGGNDHRIRNGQNRGRVQDDEVIVRAPLLDAFRHA